MEFRVLGSVEAWTHGVRVDLGGRQPRLVLAVLLLEPDRVVAVDRLIDLVWGQAPPRSARGTVQALVSRLRTALRRAGAPVELIGREPGYLLRVDPLAVDAHQFTALIAQARAAGDDVAVDLFDQALALWRGSRSPAWPTSRCGTGCAPACARPAGRQWRSGPRCCCGGGVPGRSPTS